MEQLWVADRPSAIPFFHYRTQLDSFVAPTIVTAEFFSSLLADYYPSTGGTCAVDDETFGIFRAFCLDHEAEIVEIIAKRVTNTNEVGRSSLLAPAFQIVSKEANAALGLIEIGSSAGLNLNFDRYGYRYMDESGKPRLERWLE